MCRLVKTDEVRNRAHVSPSEQEKAGAAAWSLRSRSSQRSGGKCSPISDSMRTLNCESKIGEIPLSTSAPSRLCQRSIKRLLLIQGEKSVQVVDKNQSISEPDHPFEELGLREDYSGRRDVLWSAFHNTDNGIHHHNDRP